MQLRGGVTGDSQIILATNLNTLPFPSTVNFNTANITPVVCFGHDPGGANAHGCVADSYSLGAFGPSTASTILVDSLGSVTAGFLLTNVGIGTATCGGAWLDNLWPESFYGIVDYGCGESVITRFQGDGAPNVGITLIGDGGADGVSKTNGWSILDSQCGLIQGWCIWLDGMEDVVISNNQFFFPYHRGVNVYSPEGYTSRRVTIANNSFVADIANPEQDAFIEFDGPCASCSIVNNQFSFAGHWDILVNSNGVTNLLVSKNHFRGGSILSASASVNASNLSFSGSWNIEGNVWDTPGNYAVFSGNMNTRLDNNICINPFAAFSPSGGGSNNYQNGCFYFTGTVATTIEASNNSVTSSGTPCGGAKCPAVAVNGTSANIISQTTGNRSDFTYAVANFNGSTGLATSFNETAHDYNSQGFNAVPAVGGFQDGVNGNASTLACYKADGKTLGHCTAYTSGTTCTCGP